jgi:hypothetical protein
VSITRAEATARTADRQRLDAVLTTLVAVGRIQQDIGTRGVVYSIPDRP